MSNSTNSNASGATKVRRTVVSQKELSRRAGVPNTLMVSSFPSREMKEEDVAVLFGQQEGFTGYKTRPFLGGNIYLISFDNEENALAAANREELKGEVTLPSGKSLQLAIAQLKPNAKFKAKFNQ